MELRKLQTVIDDLVDAVGRWPELASDVAAFLFDESFVVRDGLFSIRTAAGAEVKIGDTVRMEIGIAIFAAPELVQFAAAVTQGVVPAMPLGGGAGRQ